MGTSFMPNSTTSDTRKFLTNFALHAYRLIKENFAVISASQLYLFQ